MGVPSPLERAQLLQPAFADVASLLVRAAGPWSAASHELFPDAERLQAATLVRSLYHIFLRRMGNGGWQAVDFTCTVLSHLIYR